MPLRCIKSWEFCVRLIFYSCALLLCCDKSNEMSFTEWQDGFMDTPNRESKRKRLTFFHEIREQMILPWQATTKMKNKLFPRLLSILYPNQWSITEIKRLFLLHTCERVSEKEKKKVARPSILSDIMNKYLFTNKLETFIALHCSARSVGRAGGWLQRHAVL